ncbi:hypothetical protein AB0C38_31885 [Amycolatopsis sp. NPDC048633]|uniref:hypothetical protein n=1 Tax=Amycolatopsis sp. NPDC048633 TaxID=3157095 RepID=UPI0033C78F7E
MDPLQLAAVLAAANAAPSGGADLAHYQGQVITWDESTGLNSVMINGAPVSNLRVLQSGIGIVYQPGDTVMVEKRMSQWYILGKVAAPGASAANQIGAAVVNTPQATSNVNFGDLATVGPSKTVYIGSTRRALVLANTGVDSTFVTANQYAGGWLTLAVSGASTIGPSGATTPFYATGFIGFEADFIGTFSQTWLVTAADGLNVGLNTFTLKYAAATAGVNATFSGRAIAVIPF